jgi:hypothetical protein
MGNNPINKTEQLKNNLNSVRRQKEIIKTRTEINKMEHLKNAKNQAGGVAEEIKHLPSKWQVATPPSLLSFSPTSGVGDFRPHPHSMLPTNALDTPLWGHPATSCCPSNWW